MAYNELIKNFNVIRDYIRGFYVYGFDSREEYDRKSARTYDDAKRRAESYLSEYMQYRRNADGKRFFISVDTRSTVHNPLYNALKARSFTDGDITLFFIIFDILHDSTEGLPLGEIVGSIDRDYLSAFDSPKTFDVSTVRKKFNAFESLGMVKSEKRGKTLFYSRTECHEYNNFHALHFFSEVAPCGAVGSYLLDRIDDKKDILSFKHHYISSALDSEIVYSLLCAMHEKREAELAKVTRRGEHNTIKVVPLRIFVSASNGRQYLLAYIRPKRRIISFRTDYVISVKPCERADDFDALREKLAGMQRYMWGVSTDGGSPRRETVEFTVYFRDDERYIYRRLMREKRCGTVELIDDNHARFFAEVYDTNEMLTWLRTFICRIVSVDFSNKAVEAQFKDDIGAMCGMYEHSDDTEPVLSSHTRKESAQTSVKQIPAQQSELFSEIYGAYYNAVSHILREAEKAPVSMERIRSVSEKYAFAESVMQIERAIRSQSWQLILPDGSTPIRRAPEIPMTTLQMRWLKAISLDKRMKLFGVAPDLPDDTEPLFTEDDYCIFDRYCDGDDYDDEGYIDRFRLIVSAIENRRALDISINNKNGNEVSFTVMPESLEYSEKDDKFRLITSGSRTASVVNLGRITRCKLHEGEFKPQREKKNFGKKRTLTLELTDERNALERVMLHFSHFEKTAEKLGDDRYRLVIAYEQSDETEILIRVLSFGPLVRVTSPERFVETLKNRLRRQKRFDLQKMSG